MAKKRANQTNRNHGLTDTGEMMSDLAEKKQEDLFGMGDLTPEQILENLSNEQHLKEVLTQRLFEVYEIHRHSLKKFGITEQQAHKIATTQVIAIGNYYGGRSFYLPQNDKLKRYLRDVEIYNQFNGQNVNDLAKRYKVSHQTIYTAIASQRNARQQKLF